MEKILFLIYPDAATATRVHALGRRLKAANGFSADLLAPERLHLTLMWIGDYADLARERDQIDRAVRAGDNLDESPFDIELDRSVGRPEADGREGQFLLLARDGPTPVKAFQHRLRRSADLAGLGYERGYRFSPHVTLLYERKGADELPISPITFTVREFALVSSLQGAGRHKRIATWSLRGKPASKPASGGD